MEGGIETSSYSEAMDLSDLEDCGYDQEEPKEPSLNKQQQQDPPVKVRKKPGRKPNPASPALRKAQNRAAQRAFRERKERHMKDLESSVKDIKDHRDRLLQDNEKMSSENEILKAENWYLKGIVLSLQLVCLQHNLVIPQHCPHVNDETLSVLAQSIPESISSYLNVNSRNKLQISQKLMNGSPELPSLNLQPQQPQQPQQQPYPHQFPSGSLIITQDGVHRVPDKQEGCPPLPQQQQQQQQQQHNASSWYHQQKMPNGQPQHASSNTSSNYTFASSNSISTTDDLSNIPPLSPMSSSTTATTNKDKPDGMCSIESGLLPRPDINTAPSEPITSNLAAIQTLRLRLRLQSACVRMQSIPFAIQPTLLQLTIPHDPRIDLVPTPHMRDRMILYRDQFDLDDCFRCLLSGSVFHGGDPAIAGNWQLPEEFFKKYWFLTIDYNLRRYTNEWRKKQGLKEINGDIPTLEEPQQQQTTMDTDSLSQFTQPSHTQQQQQQHISSSMYPQPPPLQNVYQNAGQRPMTYDDLSGYFGMQLNHPAATATATSTASSSKLTPVQLTNGYGNTTGSSLEQQQKPQSAWASLIGNRNYGK
ncbi:hypothetical protein [Parasitella parasitica]|uniref:BZIP domain-containing protein n=1 Tax=Parasitella parasitica TaxID=35722 RepID=A0A0B7N792_9FUNG|nr:hypothetical protein [Parasitella parasitica]